MRQIVKVRTKTGFTLVETMLAVFILVVISTMLVNGFITTMGYSYQTAIYSKSAAMNYSMCMDRNGRWNRTATYLAGGREAQMANNSYIGSTGTYDTSEIEIVPGSIYSSCQKINVVIEKHTNLDGIVPGGLPYMDPRYAPTNDSVENPTYVDNRTTFFYYPEEYSSDGDILVMIDTSGTDNKYYWVRVPEDTGVYVTDEETGRIKLNNNFDLSSYANNYISEIKVGED
ncbi:MAG: prepilin-type N-terminal cleavage/methylation domain-containing protein [Clostridiales bacterium]|nr:prepilin-type N-terminal cleavage/methylation domain-containing protein [Clostridiales bacterium]